MTYMKTYLPTLKRHVVNLKRDAKDLSRDFQRLEVPGKLRAKRPQRRRTLRNGCFRRLGANIVTYTKIEITCRLQLRRIIKVMSTHGYLMYSTLIRTELSL